MGHQPSTLKELIKRCHDSYSRPFQLEHRPAPRRGLFYHPLVNTAQQVVAFDQAVWFNCKILTKWFALACNQLEETDLGYSHLFLSWTDLVLRYSSRKLRSEKDLEDYERTAVEGHVHDTIAGRAMQNTWCPREILAWRWDRVRAVPWLRPGNLQLLLPSHFLHVLLFLDQ